jgi:NAD(P)H-dependent FMN reductase
MSKNSALIDAAVRLAPAGTRIDVYTELAALPPFNPDVENDGAPEVVRRFQAQLRAADAIMIASPEYAHGVPGVLKNALDWVVGSGELTDKPMAIVNTSARARHAWASLVETSTTMAARVIVEASILIPLDGPFVDAAGIVAHGEYAASLRSAIDALRAAARGTISLRY